MVNIGTISSGAITSSGIVNIGGGTSYFSEKLLVQGRTRVAGQLDISLGTGYGNYGKVTHNDSQLEIATVRSAGTAGHIVFSPLGSAALTLNSSGNATFAGTISSGAITSTGRSTFDSITIDDDGSGSPLLRISADDSAPWALQLYREDLSAGPQVYASSGSTFSWQGHMDIRSGYVLKMNDATVIDSSRNITAGTISSGAITSSGNSIFTGSSSSGDAFTVKRGSNSLD